MSETGELMSVDLPQCAGCRWSMPMVGRYDQLRCTNDDSTEAWGDVEATGCCESFLPERLSPSTPNRSPKIMNQNQNEPKPADAEQPTDEGLDATTCSDSWIPATTKPTGWERKVLVWVVWPQCGWPQWPEPLIGWWKHGPGCFAVSDVENANHLVTHWMDISEPNTQISGGIPSAASPVLTNQNQ